MSFKNADKKYVDRHTDQSKATADQLERGAERVTRREGKQEIAAQTPMLNAKIQFDPTLLDEHQNKWHLSGPIMNRLCYSTPTEEDLSLYTRNTLRKLVREFPLPMGDALLGLADRLRWLARDIDQGYAAIQRGPTR